MNKSQKIIACYGNVNARSTAKMVGCDLMYVYNVLAKNGFKCIKGFVRSRDLYKK